MLRVQLREELVVLALRHAWTITYIDTAAVVAGNFADLARRRERTASYTGAMVEPLLRVAAHTRDERRASSVLERPLPVSAPTLVFLHADALCEQKAKACV